jgi:hypothetical protein
VCTETVCAGLQPLYVLVIIAFMGYIALAIFFMFRAFHQLKRKPCALAMLYRCMQDAICFQSALGVLGARNTSCCSMSHHVPILLTSLCQCRLIADVANRTAHINLHLQAGAAF